MLVEVSEKEQKRKGKREKERRKKKRSVRVPLKQFMLEVHGVPKLPPLDEQ